MQPEHLLRRRLFSSLVPMPLPLQREVHLWYAVPSEIQNPHLLNMYRDILSPNEKENILQMNGEKIQKNALLSRALVRTTLSRYTDRHVSPDALKFRKNKFGKPELEWQGIQDKSYLSVHFNVSHSPSLIACVVAANLRIGLDVEEKHRSLKNDVLSFARRYLSPQEVEYLVSFSNCEIQREELIKIWTIKESYVKALGRGFSAAPFKEFSVLFGEDVRNQRLPNLPRITIEPCNAFEYLSVNWRFTLLELARSHFASICIEKDVDCKAGGEGELPSLKVWKTVPLVGDELVSGTEEVKAIAGE